MDEDELKHELGAMLGPQFNAPDVSEMQRSELVESFRGCAIALLLVTSHQDQPLHAAQLLRMAARSCDRFAHLAKQIGVAEPAEDAQETARDLEVLANDAERLRALPATPLFAPWW